MRAVTGMHDRMSRLMEWGNKAKRGGKGEVEQSLQQQTNEVPGPRRGGIYDSATHTKAHTRNHA